MRGRRLFGVVAGIAATVAAGIALTLAGCQSFGEHASGERLARMQRSPEWRDDRFRNPQPMWNDMGRAISHGFSGVPDNEPSAPVPVVRTDPALLASAPASGLRVTWFGHSSTLLEIDGVRVLTDPIWSDRASPFEWIGPRRWYPPTIALAQLPPIDAVLISHDHYDHLDWATIVELDWWQSTRVGALALTLVPARHASGRVNPRSGVTLWGGFALVGERHRVYYSGDTGLFDAMTEIGRRFGPFDVALIEAGQYDAAWPDWHLGPEQSVLSARRVDAKALIPVHWGLFRLAPHGWTEPVERVLAAARCTGLPVITPRPGQAVEPTALRPGDSTRWWPDAHWSTAARTPIVATTDGVDAHRVALPACPTASAAASGAQAVSER